jgi:hypothetical protein
MPSWITDILKEKETVNKKEMHPLVCQSALPFMLVGKDGTPFTVLGSSRGCFFKSPFFTVISTNEKSLCVVLEVLASCSCGNKLFRTEARVLVNLNCFCGIEIVATPVFDYLQLSHITRDQFCLPFMLTKKDSPKMICRIDRREIQHTETISVHYTGADPQLELTLFTNEKTISLTIPKDGIRSITVFNLQSIEIATPIKEVKGTIEIQLNFCEKKNIYY